MVQLFLSEVDTNDIQDREYAKSLISLLNQLGSTIWSTVISSGCRAETRLWLCNTISHLNSLSPRNQKDLFVTLLRMEPPNWRLASQVLQMIFEKTPYKAGPLLAKRSNILEQFFKGNSRRISEWFSSFDASGGSDHKKGAKALSKFAFVNRDICWDELEWKGKHGQSPAMVATKPYYFLDLDIYRTIENFLEYVPEFWSSHEFAESLKDGEIFSIDTQYFIEFFLDFMYKDDLRDMWEVVSNFLMEESFSSLCQRLLIGLEEGDLRIFLNLLHKYISPKMECKVSGNPPWLEIIFSQCEEFKSIDQLLLLNAIIGQRRQLLRLINDDECKEEKKKIRDIISQISNASGGSNSFYSFLGECLSMKTVDTVRLVGLQSWLVHYKLSEDCQNLESWERLFVSNGISFRRASNYSMLHEGSKEESRTELETDPLVGSMSKGKEKKRKRRRRNFDYEGNYDDLLDFNSLYEDPLQGGVGSWFLSTDGFASAWTDADLPEHLAQHCFTMWINWILRKMG